MPSPPPTVSVTIPVYRGETWIGRTLDSLLTQTFTDFEVLCVDDHSPDDSAAIIKARAAADPRIRYLRTPVNQGIVPKVMNWVRDEVRGTYFAYSSQDDYFSTDWLEKMVETMRDRAADAVVPSVECVTSDGQTLTRLSGWDLFGTETISGTEAFALSLDWTVPTNALWKSEFLRKYGYFDFGLFADEYTGRLYFLKCRNVAFCDGTFYYVQGNPEAITRKVSPGRLDYPYNQFKVWELARRHAPQEAPRFARSVVRDLFESLALAAAHPELAPERKRLQRAIEGMQSAEFRRDLRRAFAPGQILKKLVALALIGSPAARRIAPAALVLARKVRGLPS